jgi:signal transduction histidine kinase
MKDIVWFIKPKNDTLDDLLLRMKDTASSLLADVNHYVRPPKNDSAKREIKVSIDFKRNFYLAFKEILTNIVKHASATGVQIQIEQEDGILEMVIHDNGNGFDLSAVEGSRHGNGLESLRTRAKRLGGICQITSTLGTGTIVRFSGKM